jgi:hypothetical protein
VRNAQLAQRRQLASRRSVGSLVTTFRF